jgi:inositol phosphorylceramide mannosyltransferase catalytic subunit
MNLNIFQFWNKDPPPDVAPLMDSWPKFNPELKYHRFDDERANSFIEHEFSNRAASAYRACRLPAMRADIFRLCVLHVYGGLYVDASIRCARQINSLFDNIDRGLLYRRWRAPPQTGWAIPNSFMMVCHRRDELLLRLIDRAIENVEKRSSNNAWLVTGPGFISELYMRSLAGEENCFLGFQIKEWADLNEYAIPESPSYKSHPEYWQFFQKSNSIFA